MLMRLLLCLFLIAPSLLLADPRLVGRWQYSEYGETSTLELQANGKGTLDGEAISYTVSGNNLTFSYDQMAGLQLPCTFRIDGQNLVITMFDETTTFQRVGAPPAVPTTAAPNAANPLAPAKTNTAPGQPSSVSGKWTGDDISMDLQEQGKAVTGKLSFGGNQYPVTGEVNDGTVSGTFEVDGVPFRFVATVLGDEMTLESDGNSFALRRERTGSAIPLGGGAKKDEFLRTLNVEDEVQYQRLMIRVLRVNANDMSDPQDDSVELYIRGSNLAQETTIEDGRSEIVANVEITALEITPAAATPGDGSVKLRLSAPGAHAVDAGQPAGDVFSRPDSGFDVPLHGDFKMLQAKGPAYVFGSTTKPGIIIVVADPSMTPQQIDLGAQQGYQDEELQLRPTGQSVVLPGGSGKRLMVPVQGTLQGSPVVGAMAGYEIPGRGGVMAVAITTQESWPQLKPVAEQIMRGIKVYQPKLSERLRSARQKLAGHSLVYSANINNTSMNSSGYYTGTSLNSFKAWHCCASGWGRYEGMRSQSFQGGGIIGTSEQGHQAFDGQWSLSAAGEDYLLTFQFEDGSSQSWTISVDENENVWVDGQKVKVTTDSICNGR